MVDLPSQQRGGALALEGKMALIPGYIPGLPHSGLRAVVMLTDTSENQAAMSRVDAAFAQAFPACPNPSVRNRLNGEGLLERLLYWHAELQRQAGLPVVQQGTIFGSDKGNQKRFLLMFTVSVQAYSAAGQGVLWLLNLINQAWVGYSLDSVVENRAHIITQLRNALPPGSNTVRFIAAAQERGIPVCHLTKRIYRFGQGVHSRWLDSSFTDQTSTLSSTIARNKQQAAEVLRHGGLPVPSHHLANTLDQALKIADQLGYPVVVKPANLDGGVGVAAGLRNTEELKKAFVLAQKHSNQVLVEKHVNGKDYRLTVLHGELIWAIERVPGGVTGDGIQSVTQLVAELNRDVRRGEGMHSPLRRLELNEEATELLAIANMTPDSVPPAGCFVSLRRTANVANGGMPVAVLDQVHADNRRLAERAANLLRLDLAGVDVIIPDISRSWRETGAAICEVNGQPNIGQTTAAHLYGLILEKLVNGDGRIPVIMIVGEADNKPLSLALLSAFAGVGKIPGYANSSTMMVADEVVAQGRLSLFRSGQALLLDRSVEAVVLSANDLNLLKTGLPVDRINVLVVAGSDFGSPATDVIYSHNPSNQLLHFVGQILPAVKGAVYSFSEFQQRESVGRLVGDRGCHRLPRDPQQAAAVLLGALNITDNAAE